MNNYYFVFRKTWMVLLLVMFSTAFGQENTWTSSFFGGTAWNNSANWSRGEVPTANHDVIIPATGFFVSDPSIGAIKANVKSITIEAGGKLTLAENDSYLNVKDRFTNNGTFNTNAQSTVTFDGNTSSQIDGLSTSVLGNLIINKTSASIAITNNVLKPFAVSNDLTVIQGDLILSATADNYKVGNNLSVNSTGRLTHNVDWETSGKLLLVSGNLTIDGSYSYANVKRAHIQMNGTNKTIRTGSSALSILTLANSSGTISANGSVNINDNFWTSFNNTGGSFSTSGNSVTANAAVLNAGGTILINGGALNVKGGLFVGYSALNGIVNLNSGTLNVDVLNVGDGTRVGTFNHNGGIANIGNLLINGSGANVYTCATVGPQTINISGSWTNNKTFNAGINSTVNFVGTSPQTINGNLSGTNGKFNNITFNGIGGTWMNTAPIEVSNTLNMSNGILTTTAINIVNVTRTAVGAITGGKSTSFVSGPIKWNLPPNLNSSSTYNFPLGKGGKYFPFSLINPTTGTGSPTAQTEAFDSNSGGTENFTTVGSLSDTEYWFLLTTGNFSNSSVSIARPTTISPFDLIAGSATATGIYTSLAGTVGTNSISSSSAIGVNKFFAFGRKNGIRTGTISGSFCAGTAVSVPYTIAGTYDSGNVFTAQLSSSAGSFASPVNIGTSSSVIAGDISATIPSGTATGTGYRIRVISSSPSVTSKDNGVNITINIDLLASVSISVSPTNIICVGSETPLTFTATPINGGATPTYQWYINENKAGNGRSAFTIDTLKENDVVTVTMTSNATPCLKESKVTSNPITIITQKTVYTGTEWSMIPAPNLSAEIQSAYTITANLEACKLLITNNAPVTIKAGDYFKIQNGITVEEGSSLTLESDANLVQVNNNPVPPNSGDITSKRTIALRADRNQYNYLISPVIGQTLKTIYPNIDFVLYYNESNNYFYSSSGAYIAGRGLAVKVPNGNTSGISVSANFKGVPANGMISFPLAFSSSSRGSNLSGNPYPSTIDLKALYTLNKSIINSTFSYWDNSNNTIYSQQGTAYEGNSYAKYNAVSDTGTPAGGNADATIAGLNRYAKVGQGFIVQALSASSLTFNNSIREIVNHNAKFYGKTSTTKNTEIKDRYWLQLLSPTGIVNTQAVVYFPEGDDAFGKDDSEIDDTISDVFYSVADAQKLIIQGKSIFTDTDKVKLGANIFQDGSYKITLGNPEGIFASAQNIYLKDKQEGIITNLSEGSYTFSASKGDNSTRFEIIYQPETVLASDSKTKEQLMVYKDGSDFVVKSQSKTITALEVYDTTGRLITQLQPNQTKVIIPAESLVNGVYILKINQNGVITSKKIIK